MGDITGASVQLALTVPGLFPSATLLQGWSTDDVSEWEEIDTIQEKMGVDGILSFGVVLNPKPLTIRFQADSPSIPLFETWNNTQYQSLQVYPCSLTFSYPGLGRVYTCNNGGLRRMKPAPDVKTVLQPRMFRLTFQSVVGQATAGGL